MLTASYETKDSTHARAMCEREEKPLPGVVRQRINRLSHELGQKAAEQQHTRLEALARVHANQNASTEQILNMLIGVSGIKH